MIYDRVQPTSSHDDNAHERLAVPGRRDFIKMGAAAGLLGLALPVLSSTEALALPGGSSWHVSLKHAHTGEHFNGVYRVGDTYLPEAFERINYILRDFRTAEAFPMDPRVIDVASIIQKRSACREPIQILSAYRSPKTNASLRKVSTGVAKNSYHMYGQALDIRVPGCTTNSLCKLAKKVRAGGVGYYPKSGFVHVDTGPVRYW